LGTEFIYRISLFVIGARFFELLFSLPHWFCTFVILQYDGYKTISLFNRLCGIASLDLNGCFSKLNTTIMIIYPVAKLYVKVTQILWFDSIISMHILFCMPFTL